MFPWQLQQRFCAVYSPSIIMAWWCLPSVCDCSVTQNHLTLLHSLGGMQVTLGQSRAIPCPHQLGSKPRANGDECKAIGFIIPAGPENRGSSKIWSLSWTSVFLPVGADVFVLTGQGTWAYGDSAWRKGSLLRQDWKCIWAWKEACFAQISYPALVLPFPHMFVLDLPLLFWNGAAAFLKTLVRNSLLCRRPRSDTVTEQMGAGHARKFALTLSRRLLIYPGSWLNVISWDLEAGWADANMRCEGLYPALRSEGAVVLCRV